MQVVIRREENLRAIEIDGVVLPVTDYRLVSSFSSDGADETKLMITLDFARYSAMKLEITGG